MPSHCYTILCPRMIVLLRTTPIHRVTIRNFSTTSQSPHCHYCTSLIHYVLQPCFSSTPPIASIQCHNNSIQCLAPTIHIQTNHFPYYTFLFYPMPMPYPPYRTAPPHIPTKQHRCSSILNHTIAVPYQLCRTAPMQHSTLLSPYHTPPHKAMTIQYVTSPCI